jgi:hypothetical protein
LATQGAGHFDDDGETATAPGLLTGTTGGVGFAALTMGPGFTGFGFTGLPAEIGFAGPPRGVCFTGAASGGGFLMPPIELWAEAGRCKPPPNAAATMMITIVLFFMGPSPDVSTPRIVSADHALHCVHILLPLIAPKIETPPDAKRSDGEGV